MSITNTLSLKSRLLFSWPSSNGGRKQPGLRYENPDKQRKWSRWSRRKPIRFCLSWAFRLANVNWNNSSRNSSYVCVISQEIVDEFFLGVNPIGETLYISGLPFTSDAKTTSAGTSEWTIIRLSGFPSGLMGRIFLLEEQEHGAGKDSAVRNRGYTERCYIGITERRSPWSGDIAVLVTTIYKPCSICIIRPEPNGG